MFRTDLSVGPSRFSKGGPISIARYGNGEIAIEVGNPHEPEYRATVSLEGYDDAPAACPEFIWLKGWSENEGVPDAFVKAGLVELTGVEYQLQFTKAILARPIGKLKAAIDLSFTVARNQA